MANLQVGCHTHFRDRFAKIVLAEKYTFQTKIKHMFSIWLPSTNSASARRKSFHPEYQENLRMATGRPYTPLLSADIVDNQWQPVFGARNSQRNGPYHNLNLRMVWERQVGEKKQHQLNTFLEIWNLYGQKSVTSRGYTYNVDLPGNISERPQIVEPFLLTLGFKFYFNHTPDFVVQ